MIVKLVELRDRMTFIPALAIAVSGTDGPLARRAGYQDRCILFGRLSGGTFHYDPHAHGDRTFGVAHRWLEQNWDAFESGGVLDVEYILGERKAPKTSECG